jgi:hypothetical protein
MKRRKKFKIVAAALMAICSVSCGSAISPTVNTSASSANAENVTPAKPAADGLMTGVPRLLEMVQKDAAGVTEQFKGREMTVIGEVDDAMVDLRFVGGFGRKVYCTLATADLDDKKQKIRTLAEAYQMKRRPSMPIVEARGVFKSGSVAQITYPYKGTEVSAFLENCSIVSVKE